MLVGAVGKAGFAGGGLVHGPEAVGAQAQLAGALQDAVGVGGKHQLGTVDVDGGVVEGVNHKVQQGGAQRGVELVGNEDATAPKDAEQHGRGGQPVARAAGLIEDAQAVVCVLAAVLHHHGIQQRGEFGVGVGQGGVAKRGSAVGTTQRGDDRAQLPEGVLRDALLVQTDVVNIGVGGAQHRAGLLQAQRALPHELSEPLGAAAGSAGVGEVGHAVHQGARERREHGVLLPQTHGQDQLGVGQGAELVDVSPGHKRPRPLRFLPAGSHEARRPPTGWHSAQPLGVDAGKAPLEAVEVAHPGDVELQLKRTGQRLRARVQAERVVRQLVGCRTFKPRGGRGGNGPQREVQGAQDAALAGGRRTHQHRHRLAHQIPAVLRRSGVPPMVVQRKRLGGADAAEVRHTEGEEPHAGHATRSGGRVRGLLGVAVELVANCCFLTPPIIVAGSGFPVMCRG